MQAKRKCPSLITVPPHYSEYLRYSGAARRIYEDFTDQVEPFGLDECWLDVTGSTKLFGSGEVIAETIRKRVKSELDITVSVGVSFGRIFSKLGSDMKKPDAVTVLRKENYLEKAGEFAGRSAYGGGEKHGKSTEQAGDIYDIGFGACQRGGALQFAGKERERTVEVASRRGSSDFGK